MITIYKARNIITMNPARPLASHVAIKDGKILGAGDLSELQAWGEHTVDQQFADKVLMPGFVEGHSHVMEGSLWEYTYCGYFDRMDPDGKVWSGLSDINAILERLRSADNTLEDADAPITGWSLDPIYYGDRRVSRADLDSVSTTRAIGVLHASGHIMNVNSKALELAGLLREGIDHPGVPLGDDGLPTGELKGPDTMMLAANHVGLDREYLSCDEPGLRQFARLCVRTGVTTATDLAAILTEDAVDMMKRVTAEDSFPLRVVALRRFMGITASDLIDYVRKLKTQSSERLRIGMVKVIADGSIQGFSARLKWPGYYNGAPNGLWYTSPEQLQEVFELALLHDIHIHTHTNGDEATELVLDTLERALNKHNRPDHRFTLQHCQLASTAQFRRAKKLGMCVNLFANHHFYWGDQHYATTVGPERAERMNACATALREGVPMAIHSDAPVTPLGPLFTAWCAINRQTASGRVQGIAECIDLDQALHAITLGAAYTLKLDGEIGSIECGKRADFAVLNDDPYEIGADKLRDLSVWGVVQGGRPFSAASI